MADSLMYLIPVRGRIVRKDLVAGISVALGHLHRQGLDPHGPV
jgi:hypothetical protein